MKRLLTFELPLAEGRKTDFYEIHALLIYLPLGMPGGFCDIIPAFDENS